MGHSQQNMEYFIEYRSAKDSEKRLHITYVNV